jgi:hypothetical protein
MVNPLIGAIFDSRPVNAQCDPPGIVSRLMACCVIGISVRGQCILKSRELFSNALALVICGECDHFESFPKLSGTNGLSPVFLQYSMQSSRDAWRITDK